MTDQQPAAPALAQMRQEHDKELALIRGFQDLTPEARDRRIAAARKRHQQEYAQAVGRVTSELGRKKAEEQRRLNAATSPPRSPEESAARSLKRMELRSELQDLFDRGALSRDPIEEYQRAIRSGDTDRAEVIAEVGPRFLRAEPFRKRRLAELVERNNPAAVRRGEERVRELEREGRSAELGRALWQRIESGRR